MSAVKTFVRGIAAAVTLVTALTAGAQTYPAKPVRIIGHAAPGGINELMTRTISDKLSTALGQQVIVESRPGAHGSIGIDYVARSAPDGHTLLFAGISLVTLPALSSTPWNPVKDFAGIATVSHVASLVVIPASLPANSLREFVDYARARPGEINSLNGGTVGPQNLNTEFFKRAAGIDMTPIGYKGLPLGIPDLLAGRLHFAIMPSSLVETHIKSGKLRALAITSNTRAKQWPDLPTMAEAGYAKATVLGAYTMHAPAGTPRAIVVRLNAEINKALADAEVVARIQKLNGEPMPGSTPEGVDAAVAREFQRWQELARVANLKLVD